MFVGAPDALFLYVLQYIISAAVYGLVFVFELSGMIAVEYDPGR